VTRRLVVEADGGSRGNPGPAGYGALVTDAQTGEVLAELCDSLGTTTNNVAEYSGLVAGLRAAADLAPGADVEVRMDSKLVVEQMSGRWQIKDGNLRSLAAAAREAARRLGGSVSYTWVPRARNARADRLANQAMDVAAAGRPPRKGTARAAGRSPAVSRGADDDTEDASSGPDARHASGGTSQVLSAGSGWDRQPQEQRTVTLLLRHGQTPLSAERRFAGRGDVPLTDAGREQAAAAAARLAQRGGIDVIVTSPLRRARRTAEAVAEATHAPLLVDDDLAEADFGKWEGLTLPRLARSGRKRWPPGWLARMLLRPAARASRPWPGGCCPRWSDCWTITPAGRRCSSATSRPSRRSRAGRCSRRPPRCSGFTSM